MAKKRELASRPEVEEEFEEEEEEDEEEEDDDDDSEEEEEDDEEVEEEDSSRESIRKLLEPFGKDQLIELLKDAALKDPALLSRIAGTPAPTDPSLRKIFVYGLGWDATTEALTAAFSSYGEIEDCRAVADRATGRCKGYGFVLFRTQAAARKALKEPQKKIGQRTTSCQLASLGPSSGAGATATATATAQFAAPQQGGLLGQGLNPAAAGLLGQSLNPAAFAGPAAAAGMPPFLNRAGLSPPRYGLGLGLSGDAAGVNSFSPSVMGRYGSPAAMQELGTPQSNSYFSAAAERYQSGIGSMGSTLPPYFGRY